MSDPKELLITPNDVTAALEFWRQFDIPIPVELQAAVDVFIASPTLESQNELKFQILAAITQTQHEAFTDQSFEPVLTQCNEAYQQDLFIRELESALQSKEDV
jgi:hypothetical protein